MRYFELLWVNTEFISILIQDNRYLLLYNILNENLILCPAHIFLFKISFMVQITFVVEIFRMGRTFFDTSTAFYTNSRNFWKINKRDRAHRTTFSTQTAFYACAACLWFYFSYVNFYTTVCLGLIIPWQGITVNMNGSVFIFVYIYFRILSYIFDAKSFAKAISRSSGRPAAKVYEKECSQEKAPAPMVIKSCCSRRFFNSTRALS